MERRFKFNKDNIKAVPTPTNGKTAYYYDTETLGLELIVTPKGKKTYYFNRKFKGEQRRFKLGSTQEMTYKQAQGKASEYNACILSGIDPKEDGLSVKNGMTLKQLFERWLKTAQRPKDKGGKKTWKNDVYQFNKYLTKLQNRRIDGITRRDLQTLHDKLTDNSGATTANRVNALLKTLFNFGIRRELFDGKNPASGVDTISEKPRNRKLKDEEIANLLRSLNQELNEDMRDIFYLLLYTGVRKSNVLEMEWQDLDFESELWIIPETKNGDTLYVPLTAEVMSILQRRHDQRTHEQWVFPSKNPESTKKPHITEPKTAWTRILKRAGIENFRIHDLRHLHASIQGDLGINLNVIGESLGHRTVAMTKRYTHLNTDVVREAKKALSEYIQELQDE